MPSWIATTGARGGRQHLAHEKERAEKAEAETAAQVERVEQLEEDLKFWEGSAKAASWKTACGAVGRLHIAKLIRSTESASATLTSMDQ